MGGSEKEIRKERIRKLRASNHSIFIILRHFHLLSKYDFPSVLIPTIDNVKVTVRNLKLIQIALSDPTQIIK